MEEVDNSEKLEGVEKYRSCVDILLYLAIDLPHAQHCIRHLSTGMRSPTKQLKDVLRHLVSFLSGRKGLHLCLDQGDDARLHHCCAQYQGSVFGNFLRFLLRSNKQPGKSVSAGYVCYLFRKCSAFLFEQDSTCSMSLISRS